MYAIVTNKTITSIPSNNELKLANDDIAISRTDTKGNILYYNNIFAEISGYEKSELIGMPHSILRHPDMPQAIFYVIWQNILSGIPTHAIVKNYRKNGDYYWLLIEYIIQKDNHNNIVSYLAKGTTVPKYAIEKIEQIYAKLLVNQYKYGRDSSIKLLSSFLNEKNIASYNDYICKITQKKEGGLFSAFKI